MKLLARILLISASVVAMPSAFAQALLHSIDGKTPWMKFGYAIDGIGDVDGDGLSDYIVGEPDGSQGLSGRVTVFSGATGAVLHSFAQAAPWPPKDKLGFSVSKVGDINSDGVPDYVVGAPATFMYGRVFVCSGMDGVPIHTLNGANNGSIGSTVADVGDINGDGVGDFGLGIPAFHASPQLQWAGAVRLYSGADGAILGMVVGTTTNASLGESLACAGDVDADGQLDIVAGSWIDSTIGSASVFSGASLQLLYKTFGEGAYNSFGHSVDGAGDVNGDGYDDVVVGAPFSNQGGYQSGLVRLHAGPLGTELHRIVGKQGNLLGSVVRGAGDLDLDGKPDFLASAPNDFALYGSVRAYAGGSGSLLFTIGGHPPQESFGEGLAATDLDGDGFSEILIGSPRDSISGTESGYVRVYSGRCGVIASYGAGCPGSGGFIPKLTGGPQCGAMPGGTVSITISQGLGGSVAYLISGMADGYLPLGGGCSLLLGSLLPVVLPVPLGGAGQGIGNFTVFATLPPSVPSGTRVMAQAFVVDGVSPIGFAASNAVALTIP